MAFPIQGSSVLKRKRFDRPRLIHQAHVRAILDALPLRHGNGRELRKLHDIASQHLRALKAMDQEPSGSFITSMLELKLDATTMFEWQRYSQETVEVSHFRVLLEWHVFIIIELLRIIAGLSLNGIKKLRSVGQVTK